MDWVKVCAVNGIQNITMSGTMTWLGRGLEYEASNLSPTRHAVGYLSAFTTICHTPCHMPKQVESFTEKCVYIHCDAMHSSA